MPDDPAQPVPCRACGSVDTATRWTGGDLTMIVCRDCEAVWTRPRDVHPLAQLVAELDPHFGAGGMI